MKERKTYIDRFTKCNFCFINKSTEIKKNETKQIYLTSGGDGGGSGCYMDHHYIDCLYKNLKESKVGE